MDVNLRYTYMSENVERIVGVAPEWHYGKTREQLLDENYDRDEWADHLKTLQEHKPFRNFEYRRVGHGVEPRWLRASGLPLFDDDGNFMGYRGSASDITFQKRAEEQLRASEERLSQTHKMEAVGQLTGGVAHDFNNLMAVIMGNTELLRDAIGDSTLLATIERAVDRGAELTQRLLAFSRQQSLQPRAVDLDDLISGLLDLFQRTLGEPVSVQANIPPGVWPVLADPGQLENALLNLSINARDAMPEGGILTIDCVNVELQNGDDRISDEMVPGQYVQISVRDTGAGMSDDVMERAFEPFFTTKDVGEGSGLGLSMVYGFARQSGGDAVIDSEPGKGSQVRILLPRANVTTVSDETAHNDEPEQGAGEVILILEDEPDVREYIVAALEKLDYRVLRAAEAAGAMRALEHENGAVDLLLTDVVLPGGVSGPEFADNAMRRFPKLKVVFMSGYASELHITDKLPGFDEALLTKPFKRAELARIIRETLSA